MFPARSQKSLSLAICIALAALIWAVFGRTVGYEFVNFDDDEYVYENPHVASGLTMHGIGWAFTQVHSANWHPLTWMSHMLDCQWFGMNPGGHHVTSVLLHTLTAILLFLVLRQMTSSLWCSAFVAAVFAIHPLRVESVAWISERKDVLSGLFFMLTIAAYVGYARRPFSLPRYLVVALMLALALMSKPMVVTLPFVLLLLDWWPLKRFAAAGGALTSGRLIAEKIPLLALCAVSCAVTLFAQKEAVAPMPLSMRCGNAPVSYLVYLKQMFYPANLAAYYPHPEGGLPRLKIFGSIVLLLLTSAGVIAARRKQPWLLTGWLWFLGMLVPVIGILQVGSQAHADRYTYLPQIGLCIGLTWAAAKVSKGWRYQLQALGSVSAVVLMVLLWGARAQASGWSSSETLWTRALACTANNVVAHNNLGSALLQKGRADEARAHFQSALELKPDYADAHINLGNTLLQEGKVNEAILRYQTALQIAPTEPGAHFNLGNALLRKNRPEEAISHYQKALEIRPDYAEAHNHLGNALLQAGRIDAAIEHLQRALEINPRYTKAGNNLGYALLRAGKVDDAIVQLQSALRINPKNPEALFNLGNAFAQKHRVEEAIVHYQKALQLDPRRAEIHRGLSFALLEKGAVEQAIAGLRLVVELEPDSAETQNDLAWLLATSSDASLRDGNKAVELAVRANQLTGGGNPNILRTLAAAYAEAGKYNDAARSAQRAITLAQAAGRNDLVDELSGKLKLYESGIPFHQASK